MQRAPLSIFRINGLGFSNVTQLVAFAGFLALFFYVTLYMQNVLGYSAIETGLAYLPLCGMAVVSAGITSQLIARVGTRPVIVVVALIGAAGLYWLSRIPVGGSYSADRLPGLLLVPLGIAGLFVAVATAANAGVPADKAMSHHPRGISGYQLVRRVAAPSVVRRGEGDDARVNHLADVGSGVPACVYSRARNPRT